MKLTTLKKFSITLCMLLLAFGIGFAQNNAVVPNWNFSCTDDSYVEIVGTGTQTPGAPPSILSISNVATVDSILVEIIFKGPVGTSPQAAIIQTSNGDSIFNNSPVVLPSLGSNHVAGAYRTMISPASTISAYVTPPSTALHTWAMIAYVYRSGNGIGSTSAGVYAQPLILNTNWIFNLPIPVTPAPKTVEIVTPIVELDNAVDRLAVVSVTTAGIVQSDTIMVPNAGTSLNMHTITLNNVPAAADKVTVNFISPSNGSGDSFIGSAMVSVNNSCASPPTIAVNATTSVTCAGGSNGAIDVHVVNGIAPYTYLWNDGITTEDRTNLTEGTYTVTVTDLQGLTASTTQIVNTLPQMTLSIAKTNVLCNRTATGSLNLSVNSGAAPYTYLWNDGATTQDRQSLISGTYSVIVTDANGCSKIAIKKIAQPRKLKLTTTIINNTCFKSNDGSIDVNVTGGKAPYQYMWNDGITAEDRSNLSKGVYTLTVTDANGCAITKKRFINAPKRIVATSVITDVNCFGENNGSIALTVTGGNGGQTYSWSTGAITKDINNLTAGRYKVTITDINGCIKIKNFSIGQPDELVLSTNVNDVLCFGNNTGTASVNVTGGVQNYSYNWSNGSVNAQANNLAAGTYSVIVTDANGCTSTENTTIVEPAQLVVSTNNIDVTCNGGTNGESNATVVGGTSPMSYEWNNGNTSASNQNLTAGTYTVTATDANGCIATSNVNIVQPAAMSAFIMNTNVSCKNGNNGTAEVLVGNGQAPYTYMWSTGAITNSIDNLTAGVYNVTVTDVNGCTASDFVIINEPSQMLISTLAGSEPTCFGGNDAEVMAMINGGVVPYSFEWNTGATTQGLTFVNSGTYTLTVTDSRGCELTSSTSVTDPAQLTISAVGYDALCSGTNSGAIDITVAGGNPGYKYEWSNGSTTEDLSNIPSGAYTVTVTDFGDEGGCSVTETVTISSTPGVAISVCPNQEVALMPGPEVDCHYAQVLNVIYNGVAGTTVKVYLETPPSKLLNTYTNVQQGQVLTTSSMNVGENKFKSKTYFTVDNGSTVETYEAHTSCSVPLLGLDFGDFHVTSFNNADGTSYSEATHGAKATAIVTASAFSGTAPYSYDWSNGMTGATINTNVSVNTNLTVTVTDANGCTASASHQINVVDIRSANYPDKVIMCHDPLTNAHEHDVKIEDITKKLSEGWTLGPCGYDFSQPSACGSIVELPCECNSGVQAMAMVYDGPAGVSVDFYNEDKIDASKLIKSFTNVQPGDSLLAYSFEIGENKFSKFGVAVDGVFLTDFHISCSVPVQGLTAGDLTVYGFVDGDGNACHMPAPPTPPAACDCDGKIIEMTVVYDGPANATVSAGPNASGTNPFVRTGVNPGDTLIVNLGNIGNDWYYLVNGVQDAYMHASCSDEIMGNINASKSNFGSLGNYPNPDAGNNLGTFLVIGHIDDAGNVCTLQNYSPRFASAQGAAQTKLEADFVSIFPNPSNGSVTLEYMMNENTSVDIKVLDITGRTVEHKSQNANSGMNALNMDLGHLNNGVYFVNLNNSFESKILKFVIQK